MQTFNQALATLYFQKQITLETALQRSSMPDELSAVIMLPFCQRARVQARSAAERKGYCRCAASARAAPAPMRVLQRGAAEGLPAFAQFFRGSLHGTRCCMVTETAFRWSRTRSVRLPGGFAW